MNTLNTQTVHGTNAEVQLITCLSLRAGPPEHEDIGKEGLSMSATPVYSELWFILLLSLLGLFLLALLLGLVLQRYSNVACIITTEYNISLH